MQSHLVEFYTDVWVKAPQFQEPSFSLLYALPLGSFRAGQDSGVTLSLAQYHFHSPPTTFLASICESGTDPLKGHLNIES